MKKNSLIESDLIEMSFLGEELPELPNINPPKRRRERIATKKSQTKCK